MLLASLSALILTSCASIPNGPACIELDEDKGWCTMTLSDQEFIVDQDHVYENKTWPELKATSIIVPASYWAKLKTALLKYCAQNDNCPEHMEIKAGRIDKRIQDNETKVKRIR